METKLGGTGRPGRSHALSVGGEMGKRSTGGGMRPGLDQEGLGRNLENEDLAEGGEPPQEALRADPRSPWPSRVCVCADCSRSLTVREPPRTHIKLSEQTNVKPLPLSPNENTGIIL